MAIYTEVYEAYNKSLLEELGLDWFQLIKHGMSGVYPDTCRLLVETVKLPLIKTVLEIGSGLSTVYLAKACQKYGKEFLSLEESNEWLTETKKLLTICDLDPELVKLESSIDYSQITVPDFLFLDSQSQPRKVFPYKIEAANPKFSNIYMWIEDDTQNPVFSVPMQKWLGEQKRYNTYNIDLVGREDRHQLINYLDESFCFTSWIWSWRPDRKYW